MPFLNNLPDLNLKGLTSSLNPMNFFNDGPPTPTQQSTSTSNGTDTTTTTANTTPRAEPGPGPSTNRTLTRRNAPPTLDTASQEMAKGPSPMKSSLRPSMRPPIDSHSESSDSIEGLAGRRKSSGTSVVILDPEVDKDKVKDGRGRKSSVVNGDGALETRRKKKAAQDTYIIVKPPPTSSKNPLNLQVQLVVQTRRGRDRAASSTAFSARSASMGSVIPSTHSSPVKPPVGLPDPDTSSASGTELTPVRSDSPVRMSGDEWATVSNAGGVELKRTSSRKSSVSAVSIKSGATSSNGSTMGGGKRIEPMFNLAVHNVMQPTVVTDAATDTKVAKFLKRQVDISGVGVLEPSEVWLPLPGVNPLNQSSSGSDDGQSPPPGRTSRPVSMLSFNAPLTPSLSRTSEVTPSKPNKRGSVDIKNDIRSFRDSIISQTLGPNNTPSPEAAPKRFFGKLFKKKDTAESGATIKGSAHRKSVSEMVEPPSPNPDSLSPTGPMSGGTRSSIAEYHTVHLGHATFGTAPSVVHRRVSDPIINPDGAVTGLTYPSPGPALSLAAAGSSELLDKGTPFHMVPSTRPIGYTWTVRKWAKRNSESWAAHMVAASAAGLEAKMDDDVVFEWVKMKTSPAALRRETTRNTLASQRSRPKSQSVAGSFAEGAGALDSPAQSQSSLALPPMAVRSSSFAPPSPNLDARPAPVRSISARSSPTRSPTPMLDDNASTIHTVTEDEAGYDSDPEDSETPWTCSVWVKKTGHRQLLGTLTPAPHHPKVIGQLKIPVGLRAISLCEVVPRPAQSQLNGAPSEEKKQRQKEAEKRIKEEVCITEEGLKDIICVSAMWLVAREEFGGLGRKKKV